MAGAEAALDLMRDGGVYKRELHHLFLGAGGAFLDGGLDFVGLAQAHAHLAVIVADHHEGVEGEALAALHDLGHAVDDDDYRFLFLGVGQVELHRVAGGAGPALRVEFFRGLKLFLVSKHFGSPC